LVLAAAMFISQMTFASVICACPSLQDVPEKQTAMKCPLGMETCCCPKRCETQKPGMKAADTMPQRCQMRATTPRPTGQITAVLIDHASAILCVPLSPIWEPITTEMPVLRHLAVPRIRPPNSGQHGFRAPPAR